MVKHPLFTLCWMGFCGLTVAWMGHSLYEKIGVFAILDFINETNDLTWITLKNCAFLILAALMGLLGLFFYIQFKVCEKVIVEEFLK